MVTSSDALLWFDLLTFPPFNFLVISLYTTCCSGQMLFNVKSMVICFFRSSSKFYVFLSSTNVFSEVGEKPCPKKHVHQVPWHLLARLISDFTNDAGKTFGNCQKKTSRNEVINKETLSHRFFK